MKKISAVLVLGLLVGNLLGCKTVHKLMQPAASADIEPLAPYSGPKARIAVADFELKATKATNEIGSGLRQTLVNALLDSNRFSVQELSAPATGSGELIITAAITEFEPQTSGGTSGIGGGGGADSGILGGLLGKSLNKAHIALDIRIASASTSEVLSSTRIQGQAADISGPMTGKSLGKWDLGAGLSAYADTPMEKAIRICIIEALRYIIKTVPAAYYKY